MLNSLTSTTEAQKFISKVFTFYSLHPMRKVPLKALGAFALTLVLTVSGFSMFLSSVYATPLSTLQEDFADLDDDWTNLHDNLYSSSVSSGELIFTNIHSLGVGKLESEYVEISNLPHTLTYRTKTQGAKFVRIQVKGFDSDFEPTDEFTCTEENLEGTVAYDEYECPVTLSEENINTRYVKVTIMFKAKVPGGKTWFDYIYLDEDTVTAKTWQELGSGSASSNGISNTSTASELWGLEYDSNDNPVVGWIDTDTGVSHVQKFNGTSWVELGDPGDQGGYLAFDSSNDLYVTWWAQQSGSGDNEIYIKKFDGTDWVDVGSGSGSGGGISNNSTDSVGPRMVIDSNDNIYVIWHDADSGDYEIYVKKFNGTNWVDAGTNSSSSGGISNNAGHSFITDIELMADGVTPVAAWQDQSGGGNNVYMKKFNGTSWVELYSGSASSGGATGSNQAGFRSMAIDSTDNIYITWIDYKSQGSNEDIYVKRFDGSNWYEVGTGSASSSGIGNTGTTWGHVDINLDENGLPYVAWAETNGGDFETFVKRFDGTSWVGIAGSETGTGISNTSARSSSPRVRISSTGVPLVAWIDATPGNDEIFVKWYK